MFRVWKVSLEYLLGYLPEEEVPEFFWNSSMPITLSADNNKDLLEKLGTNGFFITC